MKILQGGILYMMIMGMKQNVVSLMIKTILPYVLEVVQNGYQSLTNKVMRPTCVIII